jgi:hypothetical protein
VLQPLSHWEKVTRNRFVEVGMAPVSGSNPEWIFLNSGAFVVIDIRSTSHFDPKAALLDLRLLRLII